MGAGLIHDIIDPAKERGLIWQGLALGVALSATLFATVLLYGLYNAFAHPLRRYPGPLLWRAYRFPWVISIHKGEIHRRLKDFHHQYGPVVRIAPDELSYADGAAWKDIYANRPGHSPFQRNPTWLKKLNPDDPESIMGSNEEAHARLRRAFSNSFSDKSLRDQAPIIEGYVEALIQQLRSLASESQWKEKSIDLTEWFNFLTFDISGDLSFAESFDCIKNGKAHYWVEIVQSFGKGLALLSSVNAYPPVDKLLRFAIPRKLMKRQIDYRNLSLEKAKKRLAMDTDRPDFVTPTKKHTDKNASVTSREWAINLAILVFAGSETTASALCGVVRELVQNRGVLHRLSREIREAFEVESDITIASTVSLPYLNAVINEGLRIDPPVVVGVPRVVPKGGDIICGEWVPGGTYVAFNQFSANRQARNFHHPNSFIPERFLSPDPKTDDMTTFQPFGIGRHNCIGMKLAYTEMRIVLARLLFAFDIRLADEKDRWDWGQQKTYILWQKDPLRVNLRRRQTVPFQG